MKTALYFDESHLQVVLTPQSDQEKVVLKLMKERLPDIATEGGFYATQAGYIRKYGTSAAYESNSSLMIRLARREEVDETKTTL